MDESSEVKKQTNRRCPLRRVGNLPETAKTAILTAVSSLLFLIFLICLYNKAGSDALKNHGPFDSYTLQAMAWRRGEAKLDRNYPHLELAIINREWLATHDKNDYEAYCETFGGVNAPIEHVEGNEYYVSFPPVPSVPMLILSFFTGSQTPDNLMTVLYVVGSFALVILILRKLRYGCIASLCGGILSCVASGLLFLGANKYAGGPWFAAQTLSFLLTAAAFYSMLCKRNIGMYLAFAFLALAVGCRPFQIVYFPLLAYAAAKKNDFKILKTWRFYVAPAAIAGIYMWYNYVRFGSVLEFGHNYLPEFMRTPYSKFALENIPGNVSAYFSTFPYYANNKLEFSRYGFTFYVSNVIFVFAGAALVFFGIYAVRRFVFMKRERADKAGFAAIPISGAIPAEKKFSVFRDTHLIEIVLLTAGGAIELLLLMMHRTAGGWQFGMRYTVDIIPAALLLTAYCLKPFDRKVNAGDPLGGFFLKSRGALILLFALLTLFGLWLNVKGTFMMFS